MSRGDGLKVRQPTTRLLMEYLVERFPEGNWRTNVPLGAPEGELVDLAGGRRGLLMLRPWRPKVDAVIFEPGRLVLVEAKDLRWRDGLGNLVVYRALVPETPELEPFRGRPVVGRLVVPWVLPAAQAAGRRLGLEVVVFSPPWYAQRLEDLNAYWTAEHRGRREELQRLRRALGVE